ncbi:nuclear transport factor 2 family protein [Chitinophaga oryzae]|uniref:Nuclear transport factor 2 family protein n=1 Tax=Chitinophaga oryzae TaxID=2725414 RepID=A0AAE6ZFB7_9BACT|nr:nuclear transport factor 2 family protein [Chitinophaga oryzae]QJB31631.1 nuclear transport factor 2 family protein [Chitinophaga oryzae]QJB38115.1 nuclear transport factor 2 family protein [Chitinophaga oryzae]
MRTISTDTLQIKDSIRELMARYVRHADEKDWEALASLFTPDGTFTPLNVEGKALVKMEGRQQIAETIRRSVGTATAIHHLFSYEIDVPGEGQAKGVFSMEDYLLRPDTEPLPPAANGHIPAFRSLHGYGHYHGDYELRDGVWYIKKLIQTRIKLDFTF